MSDYGTLQDRVRHKSLLSKVMTAEETIQFFKPGMNLGWSGFTPAGYPKVVPIAVAEHVVEHADHARLVPFHQLVKCLRVALLNMAHQPPVILDLRGRDRFLWDFVLRTRIVHVAHRLPPGGAGNKWQRDATVIRSRPRGRA